MKSLNMPADYFDLLPTEKVLASDLVEGDMALLHNQWTFVLSSVHDKHCTNGYSQTIWTIRGGAAMMPPTTLVNVILRSIVDKEGVKAIIARHRFEEAERERWRKEEEEDERQRLRDMRDSLNRELGED
jgi:hypothetical protein